MVPPQKRVYPAPREDSAVIVVLAQQFGVV